MLFHHLLSAYLASSSEPLSSYESSVMNQSYLASSIGPGSLSCLVLDIFHIPPAWSLLFKLIICTRDRCLLRAYYANLPRCATPVVELMFPSAQCNTPHAVLLAGYLAMFWDFVPLQPDFLYIACCL